MGGWNSYTQYGILKKKTASFTTVTQIHGAFFSNHSHAEIFKDDPPALEAGSTSSFFLVYAYELLSSKI